MNYKKVLQLLEHIFVISVLAGAVGFYLGQSYGSTHVTLEHAKQALNAPTGSK